MLSHLDLDLGFPITNLHQPFLGLESPHLINIKQLKYIQITIQPFRI